MIGSGREESRGGKDEGCVVRREVGGRRRGEKVVSTMSSYNRNFFEKNASALSPRKIIKNKNCLSHLYLSL